MSRRVVEELRRIANTRGRATAPQFIVEGERINLRAVRASVWPDKLVVAQGCLARPTPEVAELLSCIGPTCEVVAVPEADLLEFAQGRNSGLVLGLFSTRNTLTIEQLRTPAEDPFLALVLVDVEEPGNVGALIRTALAGFANAVICVGVSDPYHPKAVRTSMGSLFRLPVARLPDVQAALDVTSGYARFAALATGGVPPWELSPSNGPRALFVGNEAQGLPPSVTTAIDGGVTIPMPQTVDSYSVNAATAILLYELAARARR